MLFFSTVIAAVESLQQLLGSHGDSDIAICESTGGTVAAAAEDRPILPSFMVRIQVSAQLDSPLNGNSSFCQSVST